MKKKSRVTKKAMRKGQVAQLFLEKYQTIFNHNVNPMYQLKICKMNERGLFISKRDSSAAVSPNWTSGLSFNPKINNDLKFNVQQKMIFYYT